MKLLLDTNILISLEPGSVTDIEPKTAGAARLFQLAQEVEAGVFIHEQQIKDIDRDRNEARRRLRLMLIEKYRSLPAPPPLTKRTLDAANEPAVDSHTWIDAHLAAALDASAIDYLVTEDRGLHKVCRGLGLEDRCLTLAAALDLLAGERTVVPLAPPAVAPVKAHQLDSSDPIFTGLRADYPPFDAWLDKCKREHRQGWIIRIGSMCGYAGIAIVNAEDREWEGARNPTLKLCTFKISEDAMGAKLGELLLRAIFEYAHKNTFETLFVEVFPKHGALFRLLHEFGFEHAGYKVGTGELVLRKRMSAISREDERVSASDFARKFGPYAVKWEGVSGFVVPIGHAFSRSFSPNWNRKARSWPEVSPSETH